jgi:transcription initiation factor TFIIIB Brf1 subunit/transcription initiation factor TFIIB
MSGPPVQLDEKSVRKVLARAVEIENQQRGSLSEAQVRDIARDLSIPEHVIEQALAEHRSAAQKSVIVDRRLPRWIRPAAMMSLAFIVLLAFYVVMRLVAPVH